ncbi:MCE family protein [Nocardioides sp.]|uniref:MCE family protein n=1 Tax=Nocardioides sp. TaxID=35761 RepID=UPI003510EAFF
MTPTRVKWQLLAFALVTALVVWLGGTRYLGWDRLLADPVRIEIQVADPGGLYPRADVDLLGTRVGRVVELRAGPGTGSTVVVDLDEDARVPRDVEAQVGAKSAIGEGFVQLLPRSADGPLMRDGDVVPLADTRSPLRLEQLLLHLDRLAGSVPLDDLDTLLRESEYALAGLGPSVGRLVEGGDRLARDTLANIDDVTALIRDARTVLGTQAELAGPTLTWTREIASLVARLRALDPTFVSLYDTGLRATTEVTNLLADNQPLLPVLLGNLVGVTDVAADRIPQLRKTLTVFPWVLENQVNTTRYCDDYDPVTGVPVASTCHYDDEGLPIYSLHLSQQLDKLGAQPFQSCVRGYGSTPRYDPYGRPADGTGPRQPLDAEPSLRAHCAASPTDPTSPSVRGAQNVTTPAFARDPAAPSSGMAAYDPATGMVTDGTAAARLRGGRGAPPPAGRAGLAWLLTAVMAP